MTNIKNNGEIQFHDLLKAEIEKIAMRKIAVKRDFEYLSAHIMDRTGAYISPITLRRFWSETDERYNVQPRRYTLDTLARYAGHNCFEQFVQHCTSGGRTDSDFVTGEYLIPGTLKKGTLLHIAWEPGHYIIAEYIGCEMFCIVESFKSKLSKGDTFQADTLGQCEPLYMNRLIHDGGAPCRYVCGKQSGVRFRIITDYAKEQEQ